MRNIDEEINKSEMREKIKKLEKNMKNLKFTRLNQLELLAKYELLVIRTYGHLPKIKKKIPEQSVNGGPEVINDEPEVSVGEC